MVRPSQRRHDSMTSSAQQLAVYILTTLLLLVSLKSVETTEHEELEIMMPYASPNQPESYRCTSTKVDIDTSFYLVGFEPVAMRNAHHILLFGCGKPHSTKADFDCGVMTKLEDFTTEDNNVCARGKYSMILFSWAHHGEGYMLPDNIGFKIGNGTYIEYLVLQVHYPYQLGGGGVSGVKLMFTQEKMARQAGLLLFGTNGFIRGNSIETFDVDCTVNEPKNVYPFAYRTHTHGLGKMVVAYRVTQNDNYADVWTMVGKRDPSLPQSFVPVTNHLTLTLGDIMAVRCIMDNYRDTITDVGPTLDDEMCNFYMMYYMDEDVEPLKTKMCYSEGPPKYYWHLSEYNMKNIPPREL